MKIAVTGGLTYDPVATAARDLPGIQPVGEDPWLVVRDDYAAQMAERERLLVDRREEVVALLPGSEAAAGELLEMVLEALAPVPGFAVEPGQIRCPDGREVARDTDDPLGTLGRLMPCDFCLMERQGEAHVLTGAVLCFPSFWMLSEKIGMPLLRIHRPVADYGPVAARVQRLFDGVQVGRPLWRANLLEHQGSALFSPESETVPREERLGPADVLRSERQVIWRLPLSRAVVFAIETALWPAAGAPPMA